MGTAVKLKSVPTCDDLSNGARAIWTTIVPYTIAMKGVFAGFNMFVPRTVVTTFQCSIEKHCTLKQIHHPSSIYVCDFLYSVFVFPYFHVVLCCQVSALFSEFSILLCSTQYSGSFDNPLYAYKCCHWVAHPDNMFSVLPSFECPFQWNTEENFVYPLAIQIGIQLPTSTVTIPARKIYDDRAWNIIPKIIACGPHCYGRYCISSRWSLFVG